MSNLLPGFILNNYQNGNMSGNLEAFTLFIDISGFTNMTQTLMEHSKEGAEILSRIINNIFTPSIQAVYANGGFVASFAGDAFTAIFQTEKAEYAIRASFEIYDVFSNFGIIDTKFGKFHLSCKIGISKGNIEFRIIETELQNTFYFKGEGIDNCAASESIAKKMQIIADRAVIKSIEKPINRKPAKNGYYELIPGPLDLPPLRKPERPSKKATGFVPESLSKIADKGEFRDIVSCFISFSENGDYNKAIKQAIKKCNDYGGYFDHVNFGDKGGTFLILFGAPVGREKLYERAADFILDMKNTPDFIFRAGLTSGITFSGFVGSNLRREYTALGNVVNLSARLMMKAEWGQILTTWDLHKHLAPLYKLRKAGLADLKGFTEKIELWALEKKLTRKFQLTYSDKFIGRHHETNRLRHLISPVFKNKFGGIIYIDGPAGVGKSRFIAHFKESIDSNNCRFVHLHCDEILRKAFNPFINFLKSYFEQLESGPEEKNKGKFLNIYRDIIERTNDNEIKKELERTESIIGAIIGLEWKNSLYSQLDPKGRYENTIYAIKNFFIALCEKSPLVLIFEDTHWIDKESLDLIRNLVRNIDYCPLILIALCRHKDDGSRFKLFDNGGPREERLELLPLGDSFLSELIAQKLNIDFTRTPKETETFIKEKSGGNPFFVEQICLHLLENKVLDKNFNLTENAIDIPSGINQIIISRIDRLSAKMKKTIKSASVLGREFALNVLRKLLYLSAPFLKPEDFEICLQSGDKEQLWEFLSDITCIFKHALIRDAAYEIQLKEDLRKMHGHAGTIIEEIHEGNLKQHYRELADHFQKSENINKAVFYLEKAGDQAKEQYQNNQALEIYEKLIHHISKQDDSIKLTKILQKKGEILLHIGKWEEAEKTYLKALDLSESIKNKEAEADCLSSLGNLQQNKGNQHKAMELLEKALKLSESIDYLAGTSTALGYMGILHSYQGNYSKAIQCYERMLLLCKRTDNKKGQSFALGSMGNANFYLGNYFKAKEYFEQQLRISEEIGDKSGIFKAMGNMGNFYKDEGNFSKAMECFKKTLAIFEEIGDKRGICVSAGSMGAVYAENKDYEKAMEHYNIAIKISLEINALHYLSAFLYNKAKLLMDMNKAEEAKTVNEEALKFATSINRPELIFECKLIKFKIERDIDGLLTLLNTDKLTDRDKATLYFEIWKLTNNRLYGKKAKELYEKLLKKNPLDTYINKLKELEV